MQHSSETVWIVNILQNGILIGGFTWIWWKARKEREQYLLPKLIGYSFLGAFRFIFNSFPLPVGFAASYLIAKKASFNRNAKMWSVMLGGFVFLVSLLPLQDWIEEALYPRDQIGTFLFLNMSENNAFNITFSHKQRMEFKSFFKRAPESGGADSVGVQLYEELRKSTTTDLRFQETVWNLEIVQQDKPGVDRFQKLPFTFDNEGKYAVLTYENREHFFATTPEFQRLFKETIANSKQVLHGS